MRRRNKLLFGLINSGLLGGLATMLILLFSTITGAGFRWYTASFLGAILGAFVSYLVFRH